MFAEFFFLQKFMYPLRLIFNIYSELSIYSSYYLVLMSEWKNKKGLAQPEAWPQDVQQGVYWHNHRHHEQSAGNMES